MIEIAALLSLVSALVADAEAAGDAPQLAAPQRRAMLVRDWDRGSGRAPTQAELEVVPEEIRAGLAAAVLALQQGRLSPFLDLGDEKGLQKWRKLFPYSIVTSRHGFPQIDAHPSILIRVEGWCESRLMNGVARGDVDGTWLLDLWTPARDPDGAYSLAQITVWTDTWGRGREKLADLRPGEFVDMIQYVNIYDRLIGRTDAMFPSRKAATQVVADLIAQFAALQFPLRVYRGMTLRGWAEVDIRRLEEEPNSWTLRERVTRLFAHHSGNRVVVTGVIETASDVDWDSTVRKRLLIDDPRTPLGEGEEDEIVARRVRVVKMIVDGEPKRIRRPKG